MFINKIEANLEIVARDYNALILIKTISRL